MSTAFDRIRRFEPSELGFEAWDPQDESDTETGGSRGRSTEPSMGRGRRDGRTRNGGLGYTPVRRIALLAGGAQPAVLKIASYGSLSGGSTGSVGGLAAYVSRRGELTVETGDGRALGSLADVMAHVDGWTEGVIETPRTPRMAMFATTVALTLDESETVFLIDANEDAPTQRSGDDAGKPDGRHQDDERRLDQDTVRSVVRQIARSMVRERPFAVEVTGASIDRSVSDAEGGSALIASLRLDLAIATPVVDVKNNRLQFGTEGLVALAERAKETELKLGHDRTAAEHQRDRSTIQGSTTRGGVVQASVQWRRGFDATDLTLRLADMRRQSLRGEVLTGDAVIRRADDARRFERRVLVTDAERRAERAGKRRDVMHLILSSRAGTDTTAFRNGVHEFLNDRFAGHDYLVAIHGPDDLEDKRTEHVHAHVLLRMGGYERRISTTPAILNEWRHDYAEALTAAGIPTVATRRQDLTAARSFEHRHAQRAERDADAVRDAARVAAKRGTWLQPLAATPSTYDGEAARETVQAWEEARTRLLGSTLRNDAEVSDQRSRTFEGQHDTIYRMLQRARVVALMADGQPARDAIMSVGTQMIEEASEPAGLAPSVATLERLFDEMSGLVEEGDQAVVDEVRERVIALVQSAQREYDDVLGGARNDGAETVPAEIAMHDAIGEVGVSSEAVAQREREADEAEWAYRREPLSGDLFERATEALGTLQFAQIDAKLAASKVALLSAQGNKPASEFIEGLESGPKGEFVALRDELTMRGFVDESPEFLDKALPQFAASQTVTSALAERRDAMARLAQVHVQIGEVVNARENDATPIPFEPARDPRSFEAMIAHADARDYQELLDEIGDDLATVRLGPSFVQEIDEYEPDPEYREQGPNLVRFENELLSAEDRMRDRLATLAFHAVRDKTLQEALAPHAPAAFTDLIERFRVEGFADRADGEVQARAAVIPIGITALQHERAGALKSVGLEPSGEREFVPEAANVLTGDMVLSKDEFLQTHERRHEEHVQLDGEGRTAESNETADDLERARDAVQERAVTPSETVAKQRAEDTAYDDYRHEASKAAEIRSRNAPTQSASEADQSDGGPEDEIQM